MTINQGTLSNSKLTKSVWEGSGKLCGCECTIYTISPKSSASAYSSGDNLKWFLLCNWLVQGINFNLPFFLF